MISKQGKIGWHRHESRLVRIRHACQLCLWDFVFFDQCHRGQNGMQTAVQKHPGINQRASSWGGRGVGILLHGGIMMFSPSQRPPQLTKKYQRLLTLELTSKRWGWVDRSFKKLDKCTFLPGPLRIPWRHSQGQRFGLGSVLEKRPFRQMGLVGC